MLGPKEERVLMTGLHSVSDIFCTECQSRLGWKYLEAFENRCVSNTMPCHIHWFAPARPLRYAYAYAPCRACLHMHSQKYKEGKYIVEKSRVVEGEPI